MIDTALILSRLPVSPLVTKITAETLPQFQHTIAPTWEILLKVLMDPEQTALPKTNKLVSLLWDLVGNQVTALTVTDVTTPSFTMIGNRERSRYSGAILVPPNYCNLVKEDLWMQLGAIVFLASQVCDYWMFVDPAQMKGNARKYEAEFLRWASEADDFTPNDYQQQALELQEKPRMPEIIPFNQERARKHFVPFHLAGAGL